MLIIRGIFKRNIFKFGLFLFFSLLIISNTNSGICATSPSEIAKLESGGVMARSLTPYLKNNLRGAEGKVYIHASPEQVWKVLEDQENIMKVVPRLKKVKVLERTDNYQKVQTLLKVSPFLPTFRYTILLDMSDKYKRIKYSKIDGCFKNLYGTWDLEPYNNGTILTYKMYVDLGFYVPSFATRNGLNKDLPDILNNIKYACERSS